MAKLYLILSLGCLVFATCTMARRLVRDVSSSEEAENKELFALHDKNGDGKITLEELVSFIEEGDGMTPEKLEVFFRQFDTNGDGSLSEEEFSAMK